MENKRSFQRGDGREILQIKLNILFFKCVIIGKSVTIFKKPISNLVHWVMVSVWELLPVHQKWKFGSRDAISRIIIYQRYISYIIQQSNMIELKLVTGPVFDMANITVECTSTWSEMSPGMSLSWHNVTTHCYLEGHILLHYLTFSNCLVSPVVTQHCQFFSFWLTKLLLARD